MAQTKKGSLVESAAGTGEVSASDAVDAFLAEVRSMPVTAQPAETGRLIFAMDATMSRQPTWDNALNHQAEMFHETAKIGGLEVQLVYFRGFRECRASKWVRDPKSLADLMTSVDCRGGNTQIGKVLSHIRREARKKPVSAVVYVGDCMEENIDHLCNIAGEVGMHGVKMFMFQEGHDPVAETAFREIARLTRGAWCRFDHGSARQLRELLAAVAVYAAGGRKALTDYSGRGGAGPRALLQQLS